ncbi:MAG: FAD-dependent oxidoreductase [Chloroflexi bacterium]|nr:FAD-dependent oxidoreductase [Chloroflexota bacterium]
MPRAIVVGSGAGGATIAKELQGPFEVTVLEEGGDFRPLGLSLATMEKLKRTHLLLDEREIQLVFPAMRIAKTVDGMALVRGRGLGGTTTVSCGNALRMDHDLKALGIDLDSEFEETCREIPVSTSHQKRWKRTTRELFEICRDMGLAPEPLPKMGDYERCLNCGRCVLGCQNGAKWDSRRFLQAAIDKGATVVTGCKVERVVNREGRAAGVEVRQRLGRKFYPADLVILAAGGFGTPVILQNSGIACEPRLFVDPVLCVATRWENSPQARELAMPFVVQKDEFILSPYFDYVSFLFNKGWRYPANDTLGIMIKLADSNAGAVFGRRITKTLSDQDRKSLKEAVGLCQEILAKLGIPERDTFLGTVNAGHPGGMLPLTAGIAESLHDERLPDNLYVADATLLPRSLGNPPILTIIALAKRIAKICTGARSSPR